MWENPLVLYISDLLQWYYRVFVLKHQRKGHNVLYVPGTTLCTGQFQLVGTPFVSKLIIFPLSCFHNRSRVQGSEVAGSPQTLLPSVGQGWQAGVGQP